ncbi:MAG: DPP IV N-terminal domain-containing protein [Blastocatellia bacterium]
MKKLTLFFVAFIAFSSIALAQDKLLTIDDIFSPDPKVRVAFGGSPSRLAWAADGRSFKSFQGGKLMRVDAVSGESAPFFDTERLATALTAVAGIGARDAERMANSISLQFNKNETAILFNHDNDLWHYDVAAGTLKRLTKNRDEEKEQDFSPDGKWVSFVRGNNLYVVDVAKASEKQLTRDGSQTVYNGYLVWVYEEELYGRGQNRGYWWSPDSKHIAFLRLDDAPVPKFILTNDVVNAQVIESTNYPKAGDPNPLVQLGIADVNKRTYVPNVGRIPRVGTQIPANVLRFGDVVKFVDLKNYKPEDLLIARVAWSMDSNAVVFQALNREQTFLDLNAAQLDGKVNRFLQETTAAWVEVYDNPTFLRSDGSMIWQSARNGWRHLYNYDGRGNLIRQLTNGKWEVRDVYGVDDANGWVYFSATRDSHIAVNVYRVSIKNGDVQRLTEGEGTHSASFNSTFTHFVHSRSDVNSPAQNSLRRADGTLERVISENKVEALSQYKLGTPEFLKVKTRDGFEMEAMMIRPPDFDPNRKYPVLSYAYSGPHSPSVRNAWGGNRYMWHQMMAQKGYIIWICDNRTASGKGEESTWPVYKNMGPLELRDLEDGLAYLKSLSFVDGDRIGLWGWSYGGFMTSYALTHSKSFKIGIAGGSVTDWQLYDSIYTERYMATPQNNRAGYERTSVLKAAKDLHGKLLLIHGVMDDNVHQQNTIQLVNELQKHGKQFDLMLYPTQRHGVVNPPQVRHMYQMMTDFVLKNL